ncbi:lantibiotic dehydratase [Mucilaginibacter sp. L3T2-6]|uniref:lantibiotic dehydratase n=1 Tax=Mucilaginibacter sp. L3T2-6 TaxID=3062491 RepID=UPI0026762B47|nr:lantibiotic dehydratase [Mucilaginibacter sp. L3T2-6]MDO3641252.1 lantibiotic dehydratase [Mucilaginibacter sp. L3T2-6]MDV6213988.1 lantibiotic dehydratase [Mucilaginibacter sp. L3T2-6]
MKNNTGYRLYEQAFLRTPVYSFLRYDPERLPELLGTPLFRNAIWLASRSFYAELEKRGFSYKDLTQKQQFTLLKYYNRMCFRPTPFGLFAAFSVVCWGHRDDLRLAGDNELRLGLLPQLQPFGDPEAPALSSGASAICTNPTLYKAGREWRYIRSVDSGGRLLFSIGAMPGSRLLNRVISWLSGKNAGITEVSAFVSGLTGAELKEAEAFTRELISAQVLFSGSRSRLISDETPLIACPMSPDLPADLDKAAGPSVTWYAVTGRPWASGTLPLLEGAALLAAIEGLARLTSARTETVLDRFARAFSARFGEQQVPLLLALDPDCGVNYDNLARGAGLPEIIDRMGLAVNQAEARQEWTATHQLLFRLTGEATAKGRGIPVVISADMLADLPLPAKPLPPVLPVIFRKTSGRLHIEYAGGATPAALIARFSVFNGEAAQLSRDIARLEAEQNPEIIFADISQLSDPHTDNISRRRPVYPYELAVNTFNSGADQNVITPAELLISCRQGEVILECPRLGKRIVPRLASAFNYQRNQLAVFRFLCDLQHQGLCSDLSLDPGRFFPGLDYYPRIQIGETVVSPARWVIDAAGLPAPGAPAFAEALSIIRVRQQLPQVVICGSHDQQLVFDLDNPAEADFFLRFVQGKKELILEEYIQPAKTIKTGNRPLAGQSIAFLYKEGTIYRKPEGNGTVHRKRTRRTFPPGSEWLFLKIYCTEETANEVLAVLIGPFIRENQKIITQWFFIRYNEEGHHLRLRLLINPGDNGRLLTSFREMTEVTAGAFVQKYVVATYERELERYGGFIVAAEAVFYRSSLLVLALISSDRRGKKEWTEFQFGIYVTALILDKLLPGDQQVLALALSVSENLFREAGGEKKLKIALDQNFRGARKAIADLLEPKVKVPVYLSGPLKDLKAALVSVTFAGETTSGQLTADLVHMNLNRTFRFEPRKQEMIVWHCLYLYLSSLHARGIGSSWRLAFAEKEGGA